MGKGQSPKPPRKPYRPPERAASRGDRGGADASVADDAADDRAVQFLPPLRPRPKLLLFLAGTFALWLVLLVVLRFTTVTRHGEEKQPDHEPPASNQSVGTPDGTGAREKQEEHESTRTARLFTKAGS